MRGKNQASKAARTVAELSAEVESLRSALAFERDSRKSEQRERAMEITEMRSSINRKAKELRDAKFDAEVESTVAVRLERDAKNMVEGRVIAMAGVLARGPFKVRESVALERSLAEVTAVLGCGHLAGRFINAFYAERPEISTIPATRKNERISAKAFKRDMGGSFGAIHIGLNE